MKILKRLALAVGAIGFVLMVAAGCYDQWVRDVVVLKDEAELSAYIRRHGLQASLWEGTYYCAGTRTGGRISGTRSRRCRIRS